MTVRPQSSGQRHDTEIDAELMACAFDAANSGVWVWRAAQDTVQVDARWTKARAVDWANGEQPLQRWLQVVHPDDRAALTRQLRAAGQTGAIECEYRLASGDEGWLWVLQRGRVIEQDLAGVPRVAVGLLIDIDARKRAATAATDDQTRLATALWGAHAAFWQWHVPTDVSTLSAMWFAMTGYSREQWDSVAQPWSSRLHPDDRIRVEQVRADHVAGRVDKIESEYRIKVANGGWKWILDRGRAIEWDLDGKPTLVMGVSLDIDSTKRAEEQLRSAESRLHTAVWGAGAGLWELDFRTGLTR